MAHLVDDDEAIRDALAWLLKSRGHALHRHTTAPRISCRLEAGETAGCIVLDMRMPGMSGLDLFETLTERGNRVPVIFLTGHGDVPLAVNALKKAFDCEKPFNDNLLVNRIGEAAGPPRQGSGPPTPAPIRSMPGFNT